MPPPPDAPLVTFALLGYASARAKNWAWWQMAPAPIRLARARGVTFSKLMGVGADGGFALRPNLGAYAWLACWDSPAAADDFFATHPWWAKAVRLGHRQLICRMRPVLSRGSWGGRRPFGDTTAELPTGPLAVFTRATVRPTRMWEFRRHVPAAAAAVAAHPGCCLSLGVGEYPLFLQATFSLWRSPADIDDFAYRSQPHRQTMATTRRRDWYSEELFARFALESVSGDWPGLRWPEAYQPPGP